MSTHPTPRAPTSTAATAATAPMGRRRALTLLAGAGASVIALAACGRDGGDAATATTTSTTAAGGAPGPGGARPGGGGVADDGVGIPEETAGPFPGDGSNGPNVLTQEGVVRRDIRSSFGSASATADGVPLTIDLTVVDAETEAPRSGAAVYVWHCDRAGRYSMYGDGVTGENYLRGVQEAGADGRLTFTTIFPAAYPGRWPHIHVEVYPDLAEATSAGTPTTTSQIALPEDVCDAVYATDGYDQSVSNMARTSLASDNVFGDDGGVEQLATMSGTVAGGLTASLTVPV